MVRRLRDQRPSFRTFSSGGGGSGGSSGGGGGGGGGGSGGSGGFGLWGAYLALLSKRPLTTKAVTAALLNGLGDVIAQRQFEQGKDFDWKRCSIFTLLVRSLGQLGAAHLLLTFVPWCLSVGRLALRSGWVSRYGSR
jgi:hypothetical protein